MTKVLRLMLSSTGMMTLVLLPVNPTSSKEVWKSSVLQLKNQHANQLFSQSSGVD